MKNPESPNLVKVILCKNKTYSEKTMKEYYGPLTQQKEKTEIKKELNYLINKF
jgi:hypothetical protein